MRFTVCYRLPSKSAWSFFFFYFLPEGARQREQCLHQALLWHSFKRSPLNRWTRCVLREHKKRVAGSSGSWSWSLTPSFSLLMLHPLSFSITLLPLFYLSLCPFLFIFQSVCSLDSSLGHFSPMVSTSNLHCPAKVYFLFFVFSVFLSPLSPSLVFLPSYNLSPSLQLFLAPHLLFSLSIHL